MEADPIRFKREGDVITIQMSEENYTRMLIVLGGRVAEARRDGGDFFFWESVKFVNDLNAGNPQYTPYAIPKEFR